MVDEALGVVGEEGRALEVEEEEDRTFEAVEEDKAPEEVEIVVEASGVAAMADEALEAAGGVVEGISLCKFIRELLSSSVIHSLYHTDP
jgi:hypothetical protein